MTNQFNTLSSLNIVKTGPWLSLPSDLGRCAGQDRRITMEGSLDSAIFQETLTRHFKNRCDLRDFGLACFMSLLHRHSNQSSVNIGVVTTKEISHAVAFDFEDLTKFSDVVYSVHDLGDCQYISDAENVGLSPSMLFCFEPESSGSANFECVQSGGLLLVLAPTENTLNLRLIFDGHSFQIARMQDFLAQLKILFTQAAGAPYSPVLEYSLITAYGMTLLPDPTEFIESPRYPLLTEAFVSIVAAQPADIAIRHAGTRWTYAELDRSSAILAHYLCQLGISPGKVVAVSGPRSFGIISAVLAVFRSGGTLLTIDPKLPLARQDMMLKQADVQFFIRVGTASAIDRNVAHLIHVEPSTGVVAQSGEDDEPRAPLPALDPAAPAYIFFTSGSTGNPKGVVGSHQGLAHFLAWQRSTFSIGPGDRAAQITTLSFDMVLRDIFLALTSGATLCIPAEEDVLDPRAILSWMAAESISVLHLVPSLLRAWITHTPPGLRLPHLRRVFLAGEPLTDTLILDFRAAFGESALITNFYGPTETTLIKCAHSINAPEPGIQAIGRPQPQTQVLILNRIGKLCGVNEIGEIAIRTPFRTLGYLNAPETTALFFVQNPFRDDPDDLIYLTGDSGFYRSDGLLAMRGRVDNQVKIRGMRVELGEVEAAIGRCPLINEVAVVAQENSTRGKFLIAYIAPKDSQSSGNAETEVRAFLRDLLPDNMIPSVFQLLEALPRLPNGKIDRKTLAATTADSESPIVPEPQPEGRIAPNSPQEAELLAIWQSVLGHTRVGVNDSFVELGGDSLTAINALVRMQRLGIPDIFARGIFQGWSIRQITAMSNGGNTSTSVPSIPAKVKTNLLVNVLRGILVSILVSGHWLEGLLNRLPASLRNLQDMLLPLFSVATPGFAILFGLGLGYIYFPKYLSDPSQCQRSLRLGSWLVVGGILVRSASDLGILMMNGGINDSTAFFNTFYSALLYYAIAIATAPAWFRYISKCKNYYTAVFKLLCCSYLLYQLGQLFILPLEQSGFVQLLRLMLVAKFNYFNMSFGALLGLAAGIYLHQWSNQGGMIRTLSARLSFSGATACAVGLAMLYVSTGDFSGLKNEAILPLWKWIFYGGTLLLAASALSAALTNYEKLAAPIRVAINLLGVLGQISLPVFVFHQLVLRLKSLLNYSGMPDGLALLLPLCTFFALCAWMMSRLYGLYYGPINPGAIDPLSRKPFKEDL